MTWLCKCGLKNSGLNESGSCSAAFNDGCEHYQITANKPDYWQALIIAREFRLEFNMTEQEELFAKFYNQDRILVRDMDAVQLREHRDELSKIAFEAKARLVATDDEVRERNLKVTKNKEWLTTTDANHVDTDAINVVAARKSRLSKMDKMRAQLLGAGIDEDTVNEMVKNLERKATEKDVKAITFNVPSVEQKIVVVAAIKADSNDDKPFNPSSLFGK
jgi:hypothetical protein